MIVPTAGGSNNRNRNNNRTSNNKSPTKARKEGPRGPNFRVNVDLPYTREDVFKELCAIYTPLGLDPKTSSLTVVRKGRDPDNEFSVGFTRRADFRSRLSATATSELIELEPNTKLRWKLLSSQAIFQIVGLRRSPECTLELVPSPQGCTVDVLYEYEYTTCMAPLCCFGPCIPRALKLMMDYALRPMWSDQMQERRRPPRLRLWRENRRDSWPTAYHGSPRLTTAHC